MKSGTSRRGLIRVNLVILFIDLGETRHGSSNSTVSCPEAFLSVSPVIGLYTFIKLADSRLTEVVGVEVFLSSERTIIKLLQMVTLLPPLYVDRAINRHVRRGLSVLYYSRD